MIRWLQQLCIRFRRWQDNREIVALRQDIRYHEYAERRHRHIAYHLTEELYNKQKNKITDTRSMMARLNRLDDFEEAGRIHEKVKEAAAAAFAVSVGNVQTKISPEQAEHLVHKVVSLDRARQDRERGRW